MSHPETPQRQPRVPFVPEKPMAGTLDVHVLDCYQIKSTGAVGPCLVFSENRGVIQRGDGTSYPNYYGSL